MRPIRLLLVEDNAGDVELIREALQESALSPELVVVGDGEEASEALRRSGTRDGEALPDVILLDLNLPRRSGLELLLEIKGDARLRTIPIIVLTSSAEERDVVASYHAGANCFVTKPDSLRAMREVVEQIRHFWTTVARLPTVPLNG